MPVHCLPRWRIGLSGPGASSGHRSIHMNLTHLSSGLAGAEAHRLFVVVAPPTHCPPPLSTNFVFLARIAQLHASYAIFAICQRNPSLHPPYLAPLLSPLTSLLPHSYFRRPCSRAGFAEDHVEVIYGWRDQFQRGSAGDCGRGARGPDLHPRTSKRCVSERRGLRCLKKGTLLLFALFAGFARAFPKSVFVCFRGKRGKVRKNTQVQEVARRPVDPGRGW